MKKALTVIGALAVAAGAIAFIGGAGSNDDGTVVVLGIVIAVGVGLVAIGRRE